MEVIKTDHPIMADRMKVTHNIAEFWNKTSPAWQTIWGPHIHHGYFENNQESPVEAQEKLIEKLLAQFHIYPQDKILDIGCGIGGSSLYLAKKFQVQVTGITLSSQQVKMAQQSAKAHHLENVSFQVEDALSLSSFPDSSFDIAWSLESCEQFFNKPMFIQQAFQVLKPGGRLMLATWCSSLEEYTGDQAKQYRKLCESLQLPYLPSIENYSNMLLRQGFVLDQKLDWSTNVRNTWSVGIASLKSYSLFEIFKMSGWRGMIFGRQAQLMKEAFASGQVTYGVFIAHKI